MDKIYQEAVNSRIQHHSEEIGRIKELSNREPVWSEEKHLFDKKRGKTRFTPMGIPTDTIGVYRIIYEPTMETMSIGNGGIPSRLIRHRSVFLNKGKDYLSPGGSSNGSATGGHMYRYNSHRKNWFFSWCYIGNKSLAKEYEDILIKTEKPLFNKESMGGK